jgi:hypothetical protein
VLKAHDAVEAKLLGASKKLRNCEMIAEAILNEAEGNRLRPDIKPCLNHPLVLGVARTKHHSMLAESDGPSVAIGCDVPDGE